MKKIDDMGGALPAIETGYVQREIADAAYRTQQAIESGDQVVVGVNRFREEEGGTAIPIHRLDEAAVEAQVSRLEAVRRERDSRKVRQALEAVAEAARGEANLIPRILNAVEALATLGEISDALREVFGTHRETG